MNELYIAEDGTVHTRGGSSATPARTSSSAEARTYADDAHIYEVGIGRKICFWLYAIITAILVGIGLSSLCETVDLGNSEFPSIVEMVLPFIVIAGAILGTILYGCNGANGCDYNLGAFILSPLCAVAGAVGIGLALCVLAFILVCVWYIFVAVLAFGVIVAIFSGGD